MIQGNPAPVSVDTAKRMVCSGATQDVFTTPEGGPLDLGARDDCSMIGTRGLAVRDGGCIWPDCDQPPLMSEAHHIDEYKKDHGNTNIADGVCLCRFHHLTLHNNGWQIIREGSNYWLIPPARLDPDQTPIPFHSKSLLIRKLQKTPADPAGGVSGLGPVERERATRRIETSGRLTGVSIRRPRYSTGSSSP